MISESCSLPASHKGIQRGSWQEVRSHYHFYCTFAHYDVYLLFIWLFNLNMPCIIFGVIHSLMCTIIIV